MKAYWGLPENAKINETDSDTFGDEGGEFGFEFGEVDDGEVDIDDI